MELKNLTDVINFATSRKHVQRIYLYKWNEEAKELESDEIFNIDLWKEDTDTYTYETEDWYKKTGILEEFNKAMDNKKCLKVYLNDNLYVLPEDTEETDYDDLVQLSNGRLYDLWSEYLFDEEDSSLLFEMLDSDWFNYIYDGVNDFFMRKEAYLDPDEGEYDGDDSDDEDCED